MRLISSTRSSSVRPESRLQPRLENLDSREVPAYLGLSASAFAAVGPVVGACSTPAVNLNTCIDLNVNARIGTGCSPCAAPIINIAACTDVKADVNLNLNNRCCAPTPSPGCGDQICAPSSLLHTVANDVRAVGSTAAHVVDSLGCALPRLCI